MSGTGGRIAGTAGYRTSSHPNRRSAPDCWCSCLAALLPQIERTEETAVLLRSFWNAL
ncbi:hypothetical protein ACWGKU_14260 [Kitasatospora sp. NPDC054768]